MVLSATATCASIRWPTANGTTAPPIVLTETEQNLLMMSAQGYTTEEIASRLFRTADTMKYHRKKLFRKLGVESISEALATVMSSNVM